MSRTFISLVIAASVTITGLSVLPAKAGSSIRAVVVAPAQEARSSLPGGADILRVHDIRQGGQHYVPRPYWRNGIYWPRGYGDHQHGYGSADRRGWQNPYAPWYSDRRWRERDRGWQPRDHGKSRERAKPRDTVRRKAPLPSQCIRVARKKDKRIEVFGARCLKRQYEGARRLPDVCRTKYRSANGKRTGYSLSCMRRQGYRIAWK